jgi:DNA invertase Pin-like site-specific DNA recombinase
MRAAIYLRVSTDEQTTDNQERELRATAERAGHEVVAVYRDAGISGQRDVTSVLASMPCTKTRRVAGSTRSWLGRLIG